MTSDEKRRLRQHVADDIAQNGWQYPDYSEDNSAGAGDEEDNGSDGWDSGNSVYYE